MRESAGFNPTASARANRPLAALPNDRGELMARLADDSNEGKEQSEFFLVIRPHQAVAELMAECPTCGAITSFALELAWQLDVASCSECNRAMRLDEYDLDGFGEFV
jgi:hypothetical protein